jgi:hypothetical protein
VPDLVKYILGGGGLAFFVAIGGAIKWIYDGASRREDKVENQTRRWQRDTVNRATWEALQHDWWREKANKNERVIVVQLGEDKVPRMRAYPKRPKDTEADADERAAER